MTAVCTVCGRQWNISIRQDPRGYVCPDCATRREMIKAKILKGEKLMNKSEILAGLKDLVEDRESFIEPDDPDSIRTGQSIVNIKEEKVWASDEENDYYPFDEYGAWLAYARKPERSAL
jgi:DNA-directed RNA polymerase subunit RPC12/RpoP